MKFNIIFCLLLMGILPQGILAQSLAFKTDASWSAIKQQAAKENKYIFMEVGATWCGPCHMMEKEVFTKDSVGQFYNNNFINVKLQEDSTANDNQHIRSWYADTKSIIKNYNVHAFPTYLFFSPKGALVYRSMGAMPAKDFIAVATNAMDPKQNIILKREAFKSHIMPLEQEGGFAVELHDQRDTLAAAVAADYKTRYLDKSGNQVLMLPENLKFLRVFQSIIQPQDRYFKLFYNDGAKVDSVLKRKGTAMMVVMRVVALEEVLKKIYVESGEVYNHNPDWAQLQHAIATKYSASLATAIVLPEKYNYYRKTVNWPLTIKSGIEWIDTLHLENAPVANDIAYNVIFKHSEDTADMNEALKWIASTLKLYPEAFDVMDTYSCLLYKTGKKKEAITVEEQAIALLKKTDSSDPDGYLPIFAANISKMNEGKPTWTEEKQQ